jgi:hypothetical protein
VKGDIGKFYEKSVEKIQNVVKIAKYGALHTKALLRFTVAGDRNLPQKRCCVSLQHSALQ